MSQAVWYNRWVEGQFYKYLSGNILEVGCGIANFSQYLSKYGKLTAIDINREYIKQAKKKAGIDVRVGFGDIENGQYFFKERNFNTVVCINVLEHINNDKKALKNIAELLLPKGYLVLLVPAGKFLYNLIDRSIGHFRRYEKNELLLQLEEADFEIVKSKRLNFLGALGWFISGRVFKDSSVGEGKIRIFNLIAPLFLKIESIIEPPVGTSILIIARKKEK